MSDPENQHSDDGLVDDLRAMTTSDLAWLKEARKVITPDMLVDLKKSKERTDAAKVLLWVVGGLSAVIGFDKVVKLGKRALELLGE